MKNIFLPSLRPPVTIADVEGNACMGDDKSRKQTEQAAAILVPRSGPSKYQRKRHPL
jgi:hypothetical protein